MAENNGIVVIGTVFVDIKGYPIAKYIPGGRNAGRVVQVHGGVSRNVAEDIANVELRPTFITVVDDDGTGTDVIEKLNRHRVNTEYIRRVPGGTGTWLAVFDNSGDVVASISKRPDTKPIAEILNERGDEIFATAESSCCGPPPAAPRSASIMRSVPNICSCASLASGTPSVYTKS